jgi:ribosome-associated translation inhibitor RaiA
MADLAELDVGSRVELELGPAARWTVTIARTGACFSCEVIVERDTVVIRADGDGFDGAVAGRNAFVKIDKRLRAHLDRAELEVACVAR